MLDEGKSNEKELAKFKTTEMQCKSHITTLKSENDKIWAKYEQELVMRKKLHNTIQDMKGKIRVFCRVRPVNTREKQANYLPVVTVPDAFTVKLKHKALRRADDDDKANKYEEILLNCDACFGPSSTQEEVFEDSSALI